MVESRSQTGHRRKMTSAQFAAQSVSNLRGGMESGINRIADHWGSAFRVARDPTGIGCKTHCTLRLPRTEVERARISYRIAF
jgi:hypothetical protein